MRLLIIVEQTATGFSAYSPDVAGCVATGATREEVDATMREAIEFYLESLREDGVQVPQPLTHASFVEVAA